jgi:hypothetical protein
MTSDFVKQVLEFENEKKELQIDNLNLKKKQTELENTIRVLKNENATKIERIRGELQKCQELLQQKELNKLNPSFIKIYDENNNLYGHARIEKTENKNGKVSSTKSVTNLGTIAKDFEISQNDIVEEEDLESDELRKKYEKTENKNGKVKSVTNLGTITKDFEISQNDIVEEEDLESDELRKKYEKNKNDEDNEDNEDNEDIDAKEIHKYAKEIHKEDNHGEDIDNEDISTMPDLDQSYQRSYVDKNSLNVMDKVWIPYASENEFEYIYSASVVEIVDDNTVKCQMSNKEDSQPVEVLKCDCYMSPYDNLYVPIYNRNSAMNSDQQIKVGFRVFVMYESNIFGRKQDYFYEGEISKIMDNKVEVYFQDSDSFENIPIKKCFLHPSLNKSSVKIFKHVDYIYNNRKSSLKKRKTTNDENEFETASKMSKRNNEDDLESVSKMRKGNDGDERLYEYMKNQIVHTYVLNYINSYYELSFNEEEGIPRKVFSDQFRGDMKVRFELMKKESLTNESKIIFEFLELMTSLFTKYGMMAGGFMKHVKLITNLMKAFEDNNEKFLTSKNKSFKFIGKTKYLFLPHKVFQRNLTTG